VLEGAAGKEDLGAIERMPLTAHGSAVYNVSNLAGAALAATGLGIPVRIVREVFATFGRDPLDNAGRLMRYEVRGAHVIVDYAHNPEGVRGVLQVAHALREPHGRVIMLLGHAGNRRDADIAELAHVAAACRPDLVFVKENEGHLRGRQPGEVPSILRAGLLEAGMRTVDVKVAPSELDAVREALEAARPGDAIALLVHATAARAAVLEMLRGSTSR
jgi:UDP-N-acetylmuramyl tripeptide synthase